MNVVDVVKAISFVEIVANGPEGLILRLPFANRDARLTWASLPDDTLSELYLKASLPDAESASTTSLKPQRGIAKNVEAAVSEIHVDDEAVDAAWVIHGDEPALLVAALPELRALAPFAPSVDVAPAELVVRATKIADVRAIEAVLALWHRAVFFRMGVS